MTSRRTTLRVITGALIAPWIYVVVWTMPLLEHSAFHEWVVVNTLMAYFLFLALAGMSHLVLARLKAKNIWNYSLVMFGVAISIDLLLSLWSLSGYTSFYYAQTQVVENHEITKAGYLLEVQEALTHGAISAMAMALFWLVAVFNPRGRVKNA